MPPKARFSREEIVDAAYEVTRKKGIEAVSTRVVAAEMGISTQPIFSYFKNMDDLKQALYDKAVDYYRSIIEEGLKDPVPFYGVGQRFIHMAYEEPEIYKMLFMKKPNSVSGGAMDAMKFVTGLVRESIMKNYKFDADTADWYFRNMWLYSFSITNLIVTGECPYSDQEIALMMQQNSLGLVRGAKQVKGFVDGTFDRDKEFESAIYGK